MTQKKLRKIVKLHIKIESNQEKLDQLRDKSSSPATTHFREVFVQENRTEIKAGRYVEEAEDLRAEIRKDQEELKALTAELKDYSAGLDFKMRQLIKFRYIYFCSWAMCADILGYSQRHLLQLEKKWREGLPEK